LLVAWGLYVENKEGAGIGILSLALRVPVAYLACVYTIIKVSCSVLVSGLGFDRPVPIPREVPKVISRVKGGAQGYLGSTCV
jgi:hypothetical protein